MPQLVDLAIGEPYRRAVQKIPAESVQPRRRVAPDANLRGRDGGDNDEKERDGTITYMEPMQTEPLATLQLFHVGIFHIAEEPLPP